MKNHRWRMKTRLGTRTGQKTLEEESKRHPNMKKCLVSKGQFSTFGERHSKRAEFSFVGLWPKGLRVTIMHTLFDIFAKGCVRIHTLIIRAYVLEFSDLYK